MTSSTKVLFLGIDAMDKDLILEWADEGLLPTFRSLLNKWTWKETQNSPGLYTGAVWPSIYTGVSPAKHGRYHLYQFQTGTYRAKRFHITRLKADPVWKMLSDQGKRVAIIDVPKTALCTGINGIQIVDWGTHDPEYENLKTYPEHLKGEITSLFGHDTVGSCDQHDYYSIQGLTSLRDRLIRRIEKKCSLITHYLGKESWDLFMAAFSDSHCAGHQFWFLHDHAHPRYDPLLFKDAGDPIKDIYIALDDAIGKIISKAGPETSIFIVSSHGMGPHYDCTNFLDTMLRKIEGDKAQMSKGAKLATKLDHIWKNMSVGKRKFLSPLRKSLRRPIREMLVASDRSHRKCFVIPNNLNYGAIRVNLVGREPNGLIHPGIQYEAFCQSLIRDLHDWVDIETWKPVVLNVLRTDQVFPGKYRKDLPDLLVEWENNRQVSCIVSPKFGRIERKYTGNRTGDHKNPGICFIYNPEIPAGKIDNNISSMDFVPTIASLLDVDLGEFDGKTIDAFKDITINARQTA